MTGYQAGWAKREIAVSPRGHAMQGYGRWTHRARGARTPLYARALYLRDSDGRALAFCCLDLGYVTHSMRAGVTEALGPDFDPDTLVLTCTHTHSGPGGCGHEALYNVVVPGFVPEHLKAVVDACVGAITGARDSAAPTELGLANGPVPDNVPVAWNRALRAYNRNPDVTPRATRETHLAINRDMQVLALRRGAELRSLLSLFGVHATCVGNTLPNYTGDNKGYAAAAADEALGESAAIFAQSTAGDVSPYYHGPGQRELRRSVSGEAEYAYAEHNGRRQSDHALALAANTVPLSGSIDGILSYVDFTSVHADPAFTGGEADAVTSDPCHGVAFFAGTPVDGRGLPAPAVRLVRSLIDVLRRRRLRAGEPYYQRLYASQDPKAIMMEAGRKLVLGRSLATFGLPGFVDPTIAELKRQARIGAIAESPLVPTVLPVQLITIGTLALVCCPGEFTTTAGARLVGTVRDALPGIEHVWIVTYCNDYMGYVTTREEYEAQCYEGGHTMFGKWTLAAFQTCFAGLAEQLAKPADERGHDRTTRPEPAPAAELALRTDIPLPVHKGR